MSGFRAEPSRKQTTSANLVPSFRARPMLRFFAMAAVVLLSVVVLWNLSGFGVPVEGKEPFNKEHWHSSRNRTEMLPGVRGLVKRGMFAADLVSTLGQPDRVWRDDVARAIVESSDEVASGASPSPDTDFILGYFLYSRSNFIANEIWNEFFCIAIDNEDRVIGAFRSVD